MGSKPTLEDLQLAQVQIADKIHHTPLTPNQSLNAEVGQSVFLKCENFQKTGSFKVRGALNSIMNLDKDQLTRGVVTVSAGNHAQALAWASQQLNVPTTVVMNEKASPTKAQATEAYGGKVILHGTAPEAFQLALQIAEEEGMTFIHPFDDLQVIAGQGTVGLEIFSDLQEIESLIIPVGGGGLIAGMSLVKRYLHPHVKIYGVEPEGAAAMNASLLQGRAVHLDNVSTIADGLGAPMAGELTYQIVRENVEKIIVVSDSQIMQAMSFLLSRTKLLVEPAGCAAIAALFSGQIQNDTGGNTVAILSGGNVSLEDMGNYSSSE
ncbi:MAG: threonine/serine dehydratase [Gemmatimonadota bacterium]|nr:threonine/serine dehydratase [Gemmatimonadota bacterium]